MTAGSRNQRAAARRRLPVSMLENLFTRTDPTLRFSVKLQQAPTALEKEDKGAGAPLRSVSLGSKRQHPAQTNVLAHRSYDQDGRSHDCVTRQNKRPNSELN